MLKEVRARRAMSRFKWILVLAIAVSGAVHSRTNAEEKLPQFVEDPVVSNNPNQSVPLAAVVTFKANQPVETTITLTEGEHRWEFTYDAARKAEKGLPVIGFRPDRKHELVVSIKNAGGEIASSEPLTFQSPKLPSDPAEFPKIAIATSDSKMAEPGFRLFNPRRRIPRQTQAGNEQEREFGESFGMLLMVDQAGTPVWFYKTDSRIAGFNYMDNGHILYVTADYRLVEIDMLGNEIRSWYASQRPQGKSTATPVETLTFHHDADLLDNGNVLALSSERRKIENYYTSEYEADAPRQDQWVMGDRAVEFTPGGKIVWSWKAFDHLSSRRIGYETFSHYWQRRGFPDTIDWSHANEITKLDDDSVLINFRYLSAVVKVDRKTGEILWIFGEPSGWSKELQSKLIQLQGDARWSWHQHAPTFTSRGTLLLFDNGNYRARPFNEPTSLAKTWSRAVEYELDEKTLTAKQVWTSETADEEKVVTIAMGSASETPEKGNILVGYGAILDPSQVHKVSWKTRSQIGQMTRCREYTHTTPAKIVWDLRLEPTGGNPKIGWNIFGCIPVSSLQP
ncbi:aryl-sulfate sulfotransferase [Roseiconus nitratireducens]|uniref:Aryl-sulfate sulfotransferase n=1 Tax=Roseiconus nitratireducens TaxID=2605748 RepID=A0A5M6DP73_9BACT|nr:aryl-sulfate sulfotransferase [Roseiconus nitratireducens]KAA5547245.1 aryl-sulfate sulfotransferase [Roseiconus nitratireducens]